jgi:hypothetical protein
MKYFIDTEFIANGFGLHFDLISIAVVAEDGRELYMENMEADLSKANEWVRENVVPHLNEQDAFNWIDLRNNLLHFIGDDTPEFWGWCCGYDFVLISMLVEFDRWPNGWPYFFNDVAQLAREGNVDLSPYGKGNHNSLEDAREIRDIAHVLGAV